MAIMEGSLTWNIFNTHYCLLKWVWMLLKSIQEWLNRLSEFTMSQGPQGLMNNQMSLSLKPWKFLNSSITPYLTALLILSTGCSLAFGVKSYYVGSTPHYQLPELLAPHLNSAMPNRNDFPSMLCLKEYTGQHCGLQSIISPYECFGPFSKELCKQIKVIL